MKIKIIGLGLSYEDLTEQHLQLVQQAEVLAGGPRLLDFFPQFQGRKIEISADLKGFLKEIRQLRQEGREIVVLASGDPLFFGIGAYLIEKLGKACLKALISCDRLTLFKKDKISI